MQEQTLPLQCAKTYYNPQSLKQCHKELKLVQNNSEMAQLYTEPQKE